MFPIPSLDAATPLPYDVAYRPVATDLGAEVFLSASFFSRTAVVVR
jgi:hypothetical protein